MIYVIVSFNPTADFVIRLTDKELSNVSYKKFDIFVSFDPDPIYIYIYILPLFLFIINSSTSFHEHTSKQENTSQKSQ
jgi:hypothetical protein